MAKKGIYARYACVITKEPRYREVQVGRPQPSSNWVEGFTSYSFDDRTGVYSPAGKLQQGTADKYPYLFTFGAPPSKYCDLYQEGSFAGYPDKLVRTRYQNSYYTADIPNKGTYLNDIIASYGSLPADGRHTDGFWYVFVKMASDLKANLDGFWRDIPTGWVNVDGIWRPQSEFKVKVNGIFK